MHLLIQITINILRLKLDANLSGPNCQQAALILLAGMPFIALLAPGPTNFSQVRQVQGTALSRTGGTHSNYPPVLDINRTAW